MQVMKKPRIIIPKKVNTKGMKTVIASLESYDWIQDKPGYFLIRINKTNKTIEVGFCEQLNKVKHRIIGKNAKEIGIQIFKMKLIKRIDHAIYLGRQLMKAEMCLKLGFSYVQDAVFPEKKI